MTVADQDRRARKFGHMTRESSDLGPGLEQMRRVAAADPTVKAAKDWYYGRAYESVAKNRQKAVFTKGLSLKE
jgi:hypothetical protein